MNTRANQLKAQLAELQVRIRKGELVERDKLERVTVERAHRCRELLLTAPHRHAATLAAEFGRDRAELHAALLDKIRELLRSAPLLRRQNPTKSTLKR